MEGIEYWRGKEGKHHDTKGGMGWGVEDLGGTSSDIIHDSDEGEYLI